MQVRLIWRMALCCAVSLWLIGCGGGGESAPGSSTPAAAPATTNDSAGLVEKAQKTVTTVTEGAQQVVSETRQVVTQAVEKVQATALQATEQAQGLLDQAKSLLGQKKAQDASGVLDKLGGMSLNAEQQQSLGSLKTELGTLVADAQKGLGDLKTVVAQKDYAGATTLISKLSNYQFTPGQQVLYDDLKSQAQKLLGSKATEEGKKAVGGLLQNR